MSGIYIFLLMCLCHIVDDFVLQTASLVNLKQKKWWVEHGLGEGMYKYDYYAALFIHALSWAIIISLPIMFLTSVMPIAVFVMVLWNTVVHMVVDDMKANERKINLITDQAIHFVQIIITCAVLVWS